MANRNSILLMGIKTEPKYPKHNPEIASRAVLEPSVQPRPCAGGFYKEWRNILYMEDDIYPRYNFAYQMVYLVHLWHMEGTDLVGVVILTLIISLGLGYYVTRLVVGV